MYHTIRKQTKHIKHMATRTIIGISNGIEYKLLKADGNYGLVQLKEWMFPEWCLFDEIVVPKK